jgi:hypothetical protein
MTGWWSIEVFHGESSARRWQDIYSNALIEAAVTHGATSWEWHEHRWGVVLEIEFAEDSRWEGFRALPAVQAALDAVPDPVNGLLVYRGRGGGAGSISPRKPRPVTGAGAVALPEPGDEPVVKLTSAQAPDVLLTAGHPAP